MALFAISSGSISVLFASSRASSRERKRVYTDSRARLRYAISLSFTDCALSNSAICEGAVSVAAQA